VQELRGADARPRAGQVFVAVRALRCATVARYGGIPLEDNHLSRGAQLNGAAHRARCKMLRGCCGRTDDSMTTADAAL